jgi:hypothetical protein
LHRCHRTILSRSRSNSGQANHQKKRQTGWVATYAPENAPYTLSHKLSLTAIYLKDASLAKQDVSRSRPAWLATADC